jgi:hypothetical protein|tara:strand:+ start:421 stop:648 length:228 start_codon:yes stop_codon:yes gene_type:complete
MNNYKIINLKTNKEFFLNEEETTNFFKKNKVQNYNIINLTEQKRIRINKTLNNVQLICFFALTILLTVYIIENFY